MVLTPTMDAAILELLHIAYREGFHDAEQRMKEVLGHVDMNAERGWRYSVSASYGQPTAADAVDPQADSHTEPTPREKV